jgi:hypothetical protein
MGSADLSDHTLSIREFQSGSAKNAGLILQLHPVLVRGACADGYI